MITVCFPLADSFKTMSRRDPAAVQVFSLCIVQSLCSGRGGKYRVWFTRCVEGREPKIYDLWTFAEDGTRKVHQFARVQISEDFTGETFHTHFSNAKAVRIPFLGRRSVNESVQWIDVPRPFFETGVATAAWTEDLYVNPLYHVYSHVMSPDNPISLRAAARRVRYDLLRANCVERFQTLLRETISRCLSDTCDEVLFDDDWLESYWSD